MRSARAPADHMLRGNPGVPANRQPDSTRSSPRGTQPPPPLPKNAPLSRKSTANTVAVRPTTPLPPIPSLLSPARDPVHARLRRKALQRFIDRADCDAEAALADSDEVPETDVEVPTRTRPGRRRLAPRLARPLSAHTPAPAPTSLLSLKPVPPRARARLRPSLILTPSRSPVQTPVAWTRLPKSGRSGLWHLQRRY